MHGTLNLRNPSRHKTGEVCNNGRTVWATSSILRIAVRITAENGGFHDRLKRVDTEIDNCSCTLADQQNAMLMTSISQKFPR
jgi:hypothetical protein